MYTFWNCFLGKQKDEVQVRSILQSSWDKQENYNCQTEYTFTFCGLLPVIEKHRTKEDRTTGIES